MHRPLPGRPRDHRLDRRLDRRLDHRLDHRFLRLLARRSRQRDDRGDVPGWVLITVMTLSIGMTLWGIAKPQLVRVLESALNAVQ